MAVVADCIVLKLTVSMKLATSIKISSIDLYKLGLGCRTVQVMHETQHN
jgi:hypothetical protein